MSNRVIQFADSERWAVYQSTSESLYIPIFHSEPAARIFCAYYDAHRGRADYSDDAQMRLASLIFAFVSESMPADKLPIEWALALDPAPDDWEQSDGEWFACPDLSAIDSDATMAAFFLEKLAAFIACESPANGRKF